VIDPGRVRLGRVAPSAEQLRKAPRIADYMRKALPAPPPALDNTLRVTYAMDDNDRFGNCTIVALANFYRTAAVREGWQFDVSAADVDAYYFHLSNGADDGLVELDVLKSAQQTGFPLTGEHKLAAWVRLDARDPDAIRSCVGLFHGVYVGASLPISAQNQKTWDTSGIPGGQYTPGSWGGHAMLVAKYDTTGPSFTTWGAQQKATWAWWRTYVDEAYALLDAERAAAAGVDFKVLLGDLAALSVTSWR
jgi:hypothetical protein